MPARAGGTGVVGAGEPVIAVERRPGAAPGHAAVGRRASVAVVACAAVGARGIGADAARGVAGPGVVTLVRRRADDGVPARARACLAGVRARARVVVVARRAVGLRGIRARAGRRVARADVVALVLGGAGDGIRAGAGAGLARVGPRARAVVVARRAVRLGWVRAHAGRRVARADVVALVLGSAGDGVRAGARAGLAGIGARAGAAFVARRAVGLCGVRARAGRRVARAHAVALILGGAGDRIRAGARAGLAGIGARAGVAVVARRAVRLCGVGAHAGRRVALPGVVTLVLRGADDGIHARAGARFARVGARARVAVVAGRAVGLRGVRAGAGRGVARPRLVTLVRRAADDRRPRRAAAPLARVADRTGVVVATRTAVWLRGVRAHAGRRVARAGVVAFVLRGADDGRAGHAAAGLAHVADSQRVNDGARTTAGLHRVGAR